MDLGGVSTVFMVVSDLIAITCLWIGASVFASLKKGDDPFSKRQVRILRIAVLLLIVDFIISAVGAAGIPWIAQHGEAVIGMSPSYGERMIIPLNVGELVIAGILFGLSVVFDYARLLQQLSDETL